VYFAVKLVVLEYCLLTMVYWYPNERAELMAMNKNVVSRELGKIVSSSYYDFQELRKILMNLLRGTIRHLNEGIPFDQVEAKKEEKTFDKKYVDKNLPGILEALFERGGVSEEDKEDLVKALELADKVQKLEKSYKPLMKSLISEEPVWEHFLSHIPGIGQVLASNIIAMMPPEKYGSVSALWRNCGLHLICPVCTEEVEKRGEPKTYPVVADHDGLCPKCHRKGVSPKRKAGRSIDYNPKLLTLAWKIGDCLIKQKSPVYYDIYDNEKQRQLAINYEPGFLMKMYENSYGAGKSPYKDESCHLTQGHAHARAMRKMEKIFLQHYWVVSRKLAKLPVSEPYVQAHKGHIHIITWDEVLRKNGKAIPAELAA
jgi:hypothetical protein